MKVTIDIDGDKISLTRWTAEEFRDFYSEVPLSPKYDMYIDTIIRMVKEDAEGN